ncbi:MAG: hypothetical protein V3S40_00415, partial [Kiloniellales bacterium]
MAIIPQSWRGIMADLQRRLIDFASDRPEVLPVLRGFVVCPADRHSAGAVPKYCRYHPKNLS